MSNSQPEPVKSANRKSDEVPLPNKSLSIEFWVGIFALLGVAAFAYLAVNIAGIKFFRSDSYYVKAEFDSVSGLKLGAPVEIAGVYIGEVEAIDLSSTNALITMAINNNVKLRDDDICAIRTKGIIGDRFIKIIPGNSEKTVPTSGGKVTDTESAVEFEEIIGKIIHRME